MRVGGPMIPADPFSTFADLPADDLDLLKAGGKILDLPAGHKVFGVGDIPAGLIVVLRGAVRVQQVTESGRDIVLYRLHAGESCVLTTACLFAQEVYSADAVTETETTALLIPKPALDELLGRSAIFRQRVFRAYGARMQELFLTIEDLAFGRMDGRLAHCLIELSVNDQVAATHQRLASELGSAREVISRQLKEFERRGWVTQRRGEVTLCDKVALGRVAKHQV